MIEEDLLALEREAERRVREAGDNEIAKGGPGANRRASQAMDAPMLEVAAIRGYRRRFEDLRAEIDHLDGALRKVKQNPDLPSDVKRQRMRHAEERLARLAEAGQRLEAETTSRFPELRRRMADRTTGAPADLYLRLPDRGGHTSRRPRAFGDNNRPSATAALRQDLRQQSGGGELGPGRAADRGERSPSPSPDAPPILGGAVASSIALPGGATLRPEFLGQGTSTGWAGLGKSVVRGLPRASSAALAGLSVLLIPTNVQESHRYLGDDERIRFAPGEFYGAVQKRDPQTGEWRETGEIGALAGRGTDHGSWYLTGTREQVDRALVQLTTQPDDPFPRVPPLIPPEVPEMKEPEIFPAEERGPTIYVTPAELRGPDVKIFPIAEGAKPQILIFPDMSGELDSFLTEESRRGNDATRDHLDLVREWFLSQYPDWKHVGGGRDRKSAEQKSEQHVPGPGIAFKDEEGKHGDSRPGGKWADLTFESPKGMVIHIQTVDVDKNGKPTERELDNAEAIRRATRETVILIPKPTRKR